MPIHPNVSARRRNRDEKKGDHHQKKKQLMPTNRRRRSSMSLTDLPPNILVEILTRLPPRTLFVARSVCRTLGFLSTPNPHFINLHSSNASQILVFQFIVFKGQSCLIHTADQFERFKRPKYKKSQLKPLFQLPNTDGTVEQCNRPYFLVNSCNGLLYFRQFGPDYLSFVCNPVTSEYIIIPRVDPGTLLNSKTHSLYLGFSPGTNQYKVLRIFNWKNAAGLNEIAAQVFVIGSDSWRVIHIDDTLLHGRRFFWDLFWAQHVNGLMYWMDGGLWSSAIISFDFEREKFGEVALPPELQDEGFMTKHETSIGVLGGCLCLTCNDFHAHHFDLWVMRMRGNQVSWTKEFVVDTLPLGNDRPFFGHFKPLQLLGNGEILMQWRKNNLVCYDPRTETLRYFRFHRSNSSHKVVALTPSFVSLKDTLKVEKVLTLLRPTGQGVKKRSYDNEKKRKYTS